MNAQENFWQGQFGTDYTERNQHPIEPLSRLFSRILGDRPIGSLIEFGANRGLNIQALKAVRPKAEMSAVEINPHACKHLSSIDVEVFPSSLLTFKSDRQWDLAFTKGVLIHIAPEDLEAAYKTIISSSRRYVLTIEYFSARPQEIEYRGHAGRLWKRDFAGEMIDRGLTLLDYGFVYKRDKSYVEDNTTWFLMEKA